MERWGVDMQVLKKYQKYRRKSFLLFCVMLICSAYLWLVDAIPDTISILRGEEVTLAEDLPVTTKLETVDGTISSSGNINGNSYEVSCRLFGIIPVKRVTVYIVKEAQVIPCGTPFGIYIHTDGVLVVDISDIVQNGITVESPAAHILKPGDYITAVNGTTVSEKEEVQQAVAQSSGEVMRLSVMREGEPLECELCPILNDTGNYQLGVWVRDDLAGIGTLTYVDADGRFGALGHGITDVDVERLVSMKSATAYQAEILSIIRGEKGSPGELVGQIYYTPANEIGEITKNTKNGIFGRLDGLPDLLQEASAMEIGFKQEIKTGSAQILVTLEDTRQLYDIMISDVDLNPQEANKGIAFQVADDTLIQETGGIIQGMSGAPILQNGKVIGAVTHVFVDNPTKGYGIFIETMLEQGSDE
ncbi:SpoIVB peptidase [uncultured Eubacterium sp.]|uniref:SpoIVB peptidase n=2 Tax=Eubacterium TaxID=1730 RepID=UPI0015B064DA|nr:SpoIVB peptidase [uncultured Eubacterium sp.]